MSIRIDAHGDSVIANRSSKHFKISVQVLILEHIKGDDLSGGFINGTEHGYLFSLPLNQAKGIASTWRSRPAWGRLCRLRRGLNLQRFLGDWMLTPDSMP